MVKYTFRNKKYEATGKVEKLFEKWATIGTSDELKRNKLKKIQKMKNINTCQFG